MRPTIEALAGFPQSLEAHYKSISEEFQRWAPASWDGFDGERFTGVEHLCHIRDIEIDGYHVRFRRALSEENPTLDSIEGYELAKARNYSRTKDSDALASFRAAREETLLLISALRDDQLGRSAVFEGSAVTVRGLVHHLCKHDYLHLAGLQWLLAKIEEARGGRAG